MSAGKKLALKRKQLEAIDLKMISYLIRRAQIVAEVRKIKKQLKIPFRDQVRESELTKRVVHGVQGAAKKRTLKHLHRAILKASHQLSK